MSPGGDGHPAVACIAAAAHDAQMVIVAHAPVTERVHVIWKYFIVLKNISSYLLSVDVDIPLPHTEYVVKSTMK